MSEIDYADNAIVQIEKAEKDIKELPKHIPANVPGVLDGIGGALYMAKKDINSVQSQLQTKDETIKRLRGALKEAEMGFLQTNMMSKRKDGDLLKTKIEIADFTQVWIDKLKALKSIDEVESK